MKTITKKFKKIEETVEGEFNKVVKTPRKVLKRFPTIFLLLVTAGVVLVLYGFEQTFGQINFFQKYPYTMIIVGLAILTFTGRLYKKLDQ